MIIDLPLSTSANNLVRPAMMGKQVRLVKTGAARRWNEEARAVLRRRSDLYLMPGPIELELWLHLKSIAGDASNRVKALEDVLTGVCWHDDVQVTNLIVRKLLVEHGEPFMRVFIRPDLACPPGVAARLAKSKKATGAGDKRRRSEFEELRSRVLNVERFQRRPTSATYR